MQLLGTHGGRSRARRDVESLRAKRLFSLRSGARPVSRLAGHGGAEQSGGIAAQAGGANPGQRRKLGDRGLSRFSCQRKWDCPLEPDDVWENAFEQTLLLVLLDVVRREMSPRAYLAFELFTLHEIPGAAVARQTGLTRNGVYRACKRALQRLKELGAEYREDGQLSERIKQAMRSQPQAAVEQSIATRIEKSMQSKYKN